MTLRILCFVEQQSLAAFLWHKKIKLWPNPPAPSDIHMPVSKYAAYIKALVTKNIRTLGPAHDHCLAQFDFFQSIEGVLQELPPLPEKFAAYFAKFPGNQTISGSPAGIYAFLFSPFNNSW
jgi:hypothetical protein